MTAYRVRVALRIGGDAESVETFTDDLMESLVARNDGDDLGGSLASGELDVWVTEVAPSPTDAVVRGTATVRAAAHAARSTSGAEWPQGVREIAGEATELVAAAG